MKKFYLGALGCLLAMGASAQKFDQVGTMQGEFWNLQSIPVEYAYGGKSSVYTINEAESAVEFTVYNNSFAVERTIKVSDPTSYKRTEVESREGIIVLSGFGKIECGNRDLHYLGDGNFISYPRWWAENKSTNATYTDEYVDEYIESEGYYSVIEKKTYDEGTLFITRSNGMGYYFKNNQLFEARYDAESDELHIYPYEVYTYCDFYNAQAAEFTQEHIIEYINQQGTSTFFSVQTESGSIYFSDYRFFDTEVVSDDSIIFHTITDSYKDLKFVWNKNLGILTAIGTSYRDSYTGEWQKSLEDDNYDEKEEWIWDAGIYPFCVGELIGEMDGGIYATQTLFNNDEKWEFLRPTYKEVAISDSYYERDRDGDGEVDYKQTRYINKLKAYEVISEEGNVLSTIPVPEGDWYYPLLIQWDGEVYFGISVEDVEQDDGYYYEEYTIIYSIDKNASSVKKIASTPAMRVSPALAERNSTVNVTLDAETVKNGGELIITDSNGRTVGRSHVEAGQTSVPVTTDRMGSGVYNITLTEKGQKVENAHIIVK